MDKSLEKAPAAPKFTACAIRDEDAVVSAVCVVVIAVASPLDDLGWFQTDFLFPPEVLANGYSCQYFKAGDFPIELGRRLGLEMYL